mgnify:CR=1 FL=1
MGAGRGFGVILHGEHRSLFVAESFNSAVIEVDVCDFHAGRQGIRIKREVVVLRGYFNGSGRKVLDRVIAW